MIIIKSHGFPGPGGNRVAIAVVGGAQAVVEILLSFRGRMLNPPETGKLIRTSRTLEGS